MACCLGRRLDFLHHTPTRLALPCPCPGQLPWVSRLTSSFLWAVPSLLRPGPWAQCVGGGRGGTMPPPGGPCIWSRSRPALLWQSGRPGGEVRLSGSQGRPLPGTQWSGGRSFPSWLRGEGHSAPWPHRAAVAQVGWAWAQGGVRQGVSGQTPCALPLGLGTIWELHLQGLGSVARGFRSQGTPGEKGVPRPVCVWWGEDSSRTGRASLGVWSD